MGQARRKFWGWGREGEGLTEDEAQETRSRVAAQYGVDELEAVAPPEVGDIELRPSRLSPPQSLEALCTSEPYERLLHSYGRSFADSVRIFRREFPNPPDIVRNHVFLAL